MKIQIDTEKKVVKVKGATNLKSLFDWLKQCLPQGEWEEYTLETNTVFENTPITFPLNPLPQTTPYTPSPVTWPNTPTSPWQLGSIPTITFGGSSSGTTTVQTNANNSIFTINTTP